MSERGKQLLATADGQISELIGLLRTLGEAALSRPCPGGSGRPQGRQRSPRFVLDGGHAPRRKQDSDHRAGANGGDYTAHNVDGHLLLERLSAGRYALQLLAEMTDEQLDVVPPAGSFKFCNGQRTLEQVVASLLNHQGHQIDATNATEA